MTLRSPYLSGRIPQKLVLDRRWSPEAMGLSLFSASQSVAVAEYSRLGKLLEVKGGVLGFASQYFLNVI